MASELRTNYPGAGAVLYAVIRRISDNYVWNGSSFEAWVDGHIATYTVSLTDRGGDYYTADWPDSVDADDYRVFFYLQAGGSAAITDLLVPTGYERHWDGSALTSISSVVLSSYALCTLDEVKRDLTITDSSLDTVLTEDINQTSALIERYLKGRKLLARDLRERRDRLNAKRLILKQWPLINVTRIAYGRADAMSLIYTGAGIRADASVYNDYSTTTAGGLRLKTISTTGVATTTDLPFTTYPSVLVLAAAVSLVSGWSASVVRNQFSYDLNPATLGNALNQTIYATYPDLQADYNIIDYETGIVELRTLVPSRDRTQSTQEYIHGFHGVIIEYRAGYETIPDDINMVARELVRTRYYARKTDPSITQINLISYSATFDRDEKTWLQNKLASYIDPARCIN